MLGLKSQVVGTEVTDWKGGIFLVEGRVVVVS